MDTIASIPSVALTYTPTMPVKLPTWQPGARNRGIPKRGPRRLKLVKLGEAPTVHVTNGRSRIVMSSVCTWADARPWKPKRERAKK